MQLVGRFKKALKMAGVRAVGLAQPRNVVAQIDALQASNVRRLETRGQLVAPSKPARRLPWAS